MNSCTYISFKHLLLLANLGKVVSGVLTSTNRRCLGYHERLLEPLAINTVSSAILGFLINDRFLEVEVAFRNMLLDDGPIKQKTNVRFL